MNVPVASEYTPGDTGETQLRVSAVAIEPERRASGGRPAMALGLQILAPRRLSILISSVLLLLSACGKSQPAGGDVATRPTRGGPAMTVEVEMVRAQALAHRIPIVGTLFAAEAAVISTKAAGLLRQTFVDVGNKVKPGDPLAQVDRIDYEMAVRQAEALLAESLARLGVESVPSESIDLKLVSTVQRADAQLENAKRTFDRLTNLEGAVSAQERDDITARLRVAEADHRLALDEAGALAASARGRNAALEFAKQKLSETLTLTPPIPTTLGKSGAAEWVVAERVVTEGQYLNVADAVYRLIINDPLKLRSKVPERYASEILIDQSVQLEDVDGNAAARGKIARISPAVDPASRTFEIEALIDNESDALKSGTFAKGMIVAEGTTKTLSVPAAAIVTAGGATQLFVIENGTARRRVVQIGRQADGRIQIVSGLNEGEQVVSRATAALTDGAAVRVQ